MDDEDNDDEYGIVRGLRQGARAWLTCVLGKKN